MNRVPSGAALAALPSEAMADVYSAQPGVQRDRADLGSSRAAADEIDANTARMAARRGTPDTPPDSTSGEENQDRGGNDPA